MQDDKNERYERADAAAEKTLQIEALRKHIKLLKQRIKSDGANADDFKASLRGQRRMQRKYGVWRVKRDAFEREPIAKPDGSKTPVERAGRPISEQPGGLDWERRNQ